jgi:glycosyltransferase involved in cell wall biosynthesis
MGNVAKPELVSICIPTYNRPDLLQEAIESCIAQTYQDFEIVISDDSSNTLSQSVVAEYQSKHPDKIRYFRNTPSLGQAANVNALFNSAAGGKMVLLHDDDLLLPTALEDLSNCWNLMPSLTAAFGKQYFMGMDGEIMLAESERNNAFFGRTKEAAGAVMPALAGIRRMFPNDSYMILTATAREVGYRPFSEVGQACDFDFAFRCCVNAGSVWFHDGYTAIYRISGDAISKTAITAPYVYKILNDYKSAHKQLAPEVEHAIDQVLAYFAPRALSGHARMGQGRAALKILVSPNYATRERFRLKFLWHSALTFSALVAGSSGSNAIISAMKWGEGLKRPRRISG